MPRIAIVSESARENPASRHPSGGGHVLRGLLAQAGIEEQDYAFFSLLKKDDLRDILTREKKMAVPEFPPLEPGKYFPASHTAELSLLLSQLREASPNVIVALGNSAMWATTRLTGISKWRGTPSMSFNGQWKVIPTWNPGAVVKQWELRPIAFMDLVKAKRHAESPVLSRPASYIHIEPNLSEIAAFYEKYIVPAPYLAADIETKGGQITEIGFAVSPRRAIVIPFWHRERHNYWPTAKAEREAWEWVRRILAEKPTVWQNGQYDVQYLWRTVGIPVPLFHGDTMLLHHALQPEMKKGLGFLASIYTDRPQWKDMRASGETMKREDD